MLSLECSINGESWSAVQLAHVEHARHLHVLHDLVRRGASLELTDDAIDLLDPATAREASVAARSTLDVDGLRALFAEQLTTSQRMWSRAHDAPADAALRPAVADLAVIGLAPDELRARLADARGIQPAYLQLHPEHFAMTERDDGHYVMETFGMYGGPTEMVVIADASMPPPVEPSPGYEVFTSGYTRAVSGAARLHIPAFHQVAATEGGLAVKLGAFFPPRTPTPIVEGHGLHMATEFWRLVQILAA